LRGFRRALLGGQSIGLRFQEFLFCDEVTDTLNQRAQRSWRIEDQLQLLVESVKDYAIFMLDPEGNVATWNQGAELIKGYKADEVRGRHFSIFYTPEEMEEGKPAQELRIAATEGRFEAEGWRVRKDGTRFCANVIITAIRNEQGRLCGYGKVTRDLTERKWAMGSTFEKLFRVNPYPIMLSTLEDGRYLEVNESFCKLTRYSAKELIGQRSNDLGIWVEPDMRTRVVSELSAGHPVRELETTLRTKAGQMRTVQLSADLIEFAGNRCLFATLMDITESRRLEAAVEELSTPVLQAQEGLLVVPLIGLVDARRAAQLRTQLLNDIRAQRAKAVVIDLTGVPKIDPETADGLLRTVEAVRLLGAFVILAGISLGIADTLVGIGAELLTIKTTADLQSGLEEAKALMDQANN
jgi:rsbT co-antagonist protein RsbR